MKNTTKAARKPSTRKPAADTANNLPAVTVPVIEIDPETIESATQSTPNAETTQTTQSTQSDTQSNAREYATASATNANENSLEHDENPLKYLQTHHIFFAAYRTPNSRKLQKIALFRIDRARIEKMTISAARTIYLVNSFFLDTCDIYEHTDKVPTLDFDTVAEQIDRVEVVPVLAVLRDPQKYNEYIRYYRRAYKSETARKLFAALLAQFCPAAEADREHAAK